MCPNGTGLVGCGPQEEFRACADVAILDSSGEADETPYIPNEIETEVPKDTDTGEKPKEGQTEWWFLLVVIILTIFLVLATFFLIYFYFYKWKTVKEWWEQKHLPVFHQSPREITFWKTISLLDKKRTNENPIVKVENFVPPQPVPPPRTKRINKGPEGREF